MKNEKKQQLKENDYMSLNTMVRNALKQFKNEVVIDDIHQIYNDILQNISQKNVDIIESKTKKVLEKDDTLVYLEFMLNYYALEHIIKFFAETQEAIYDTLRAEGISDQMLVDTVRSLTGENISLSIGMKKELNVALKKMHLISENDMRISQEKYEQYKVRLN